MEDNSSQDAQQYDPLSSATPVANSVLLGPRTVDDELNNVSLNENDDYLSTNLSHIHLLHPTGNTDPNLNLQYFTDTSNERLKSKSIITPSVGANYDPNSDITFLYDLVTPPTTSIIRPSGQSQPNHTDNQFFDDNWNG
jgi:hypothetical protein